MKLELIEFIVNHKEFQKQIEKDLFNHNTTIVEDVGIFWAKIVALGVNFKIL